MSGPIQLEILGPYMAINGAVGEPPMDVALIN